MKERGIFRNGCVTPRDGTIMNLLNLMLIKRNFVSDLGMPPQALAVVLTI